MHKLKFIALFSALVITSGCTVFGQPVQNDLGKQATSGEVANQPFSYDLYDKVLKTYVTEDGWVDYEGLKANRADLDAFNASLGAIAADEFDTWSDEEKIAFWLNAYNSLTLQAIVDNDPEKSIREIPGVWKRLKFTVIGEERTLDQIEHEILRKEFDEPRIHMGLVCASIGCPILRTESYTGEKLSEQLDDQTEKFIALPRNFKIDQSEGQVGISSIFDWFGQDFESKFAAGEKFAKFGDKKGSVLNFISQYLDDDQKTYLEQGNYSVKYLDYDWGLNAQ